MPKETKKTQKSKKEVNGLSIKNHHKSAEDRIKRPADHSAGLIYMYANYLTYYSNNALWIRMNSDSKFIRIKSSNTKLNLEILHHFKSQRNVRMNLEDE